MNISDFYGENASDISEDLFDKIREIIKKLANHYIEYPDITGYNFIEYNNKLWIIDFEHSKIIKNDLDSFVQKFINGSNEWNPNFR
jgi:hypothetical protein